MKGELARCVRELVRGVFKENEMEITMGYLSYNLMCTSGSAHISVGKLMKYIKGKNSRKVMSGLKTILKMYWARAFRLGNQSNDMWCNALIVSV